MSKQSDSVKKWRENCKLRIIEAMGGACCVCGYNKCAAALVLHHLDPTQKDFALGGIRANPQSWDTIVKELRKCVLVCQNCHNEIHYGDTLIPEDAPSFNEEFVDYKLLQRKLNDEITYCPACSIQKLNQNKYCSRVCAKKMQRPTLFKAFEFLDLKEELKTKTVLQISKEVKCSDVTIYKRFRALGLNPPYNK